MVQHEKEKNTHTHQQRAKKSSFEGNEEKNIPRKKNGRSPKSNTLKLQFFFVFFSFLFSLYLSTASCRTDLLISFYQEF